ncbi:hypothetical protein [Conexibacter sp. SYSU D00693]|uniref:linalool dehydratase/isomerase domain-containing protein n=1 Tax=Conexibacter sp. SYSU D00693 TaxID=2812560 RepID=UPI00196AB9E2|nr:hypothetical protein [Conexibacter sp. SYSU D00693]
MSATIDRPAPAPATYLRPGERLDRPPVALIPERDRPDGPVTTSRLRRSVAAYAAMAGAGAVAARVLGARPAANAALGTVLPGAGYLSAGRPVAFASTQAAFGLSLVAWLGSGNVVAPVATWAGSALHSARRPAARRGATTAVPATAAAVLASGWAARELAHRGAVRRRDRRNARLRALAADEAVSAAPRVETPKGPARPQVGPELTADELAHARWVLDRALQPVDQFEGFDKIEQFQTSSVRYQVTTLGHALSTLQFERTPAFHGYLSEAQRRLIDKWQERICWAYWAKESVWGHLAYNPDPVPRDNIMLTGWLGYQIASYASNTGDRRYEEPGSITFRHPRGQAYEHSFHSIVHALVRGFEGSDFTLFPCEPNWIYALCNGYGVLPLPVHDRLHGTDFSERVLPSFRRAFEQEFLSVDGRTVGIRSSLTGFSLPAMTSILSDCAVIWQLSPVFPDLARGLWEVVRDEWIEVPSTGPVRIAMKGWDKVDLGNYKREVPATAFSAISWAALEMGDTELAARLRADAEATLDPVVDGGVKHYRRISTLNNGALLGAFAGGVSTHRRRIAGGLPEALARGPVLDGAAYPDVLVARATSDGEDLELVLRPGRDDAGRQTLEVARLTPGRTYALRGATTEAVTAGPDGRARVDVDLDGRTEVRLVPEA